MLDFSYIMAVSIAVFAIGIAGVATNKHFVVIMLGIELMLVASMIAVVGYFSYLQDPDPIGIVLLLSIWAVAAVEVIAIVAFYVYMKYIDFDFDVTKLSKLKW